MSKGKFRPKLTYLDPKLSFIDMDEQYCHSRQINRQRTEYVDRILRYAKYTNYSDDELLYFWDWGYSEEELEYMLLCGRSTLEMKEEFMNGLY